MYTTRQDQSGFHVDYRSYRMALVLLLLPPLMIYEFGPSLLDGSIDNSEVAALLFGIFLPLFGALFTFELASFHFSLDDGSFQWRWRGMLRRKSLDLPLQRIVRVRREAVESRDSGDSVYRFRLVVVLDDDSVVGLTRSYSRIHKRKLELIVEDIREYLGHVVPMP